MHFLHRISVLLVLAIWLTATQHCALEAAGFWAGDAHESSQACCPGKGSCTQDGCDEVEGGSVTRATTSIRVMSPDLQAFVCLLYFVAVSPQAFEPQSLELLGATEPSVGWVPTWYFERRAAPLPGAPALILA